MGECYSPFPGFHLWYMFVVCAMRCELITRKCIYANGRLYSENMEKYTLNGLPFLFRQSWCYAQFDTRIDPPRITRLVFVDDENGEESEGK
jgi:hypothetical protein